MFDHRLKLVDAVFCRFCRSKETHQTSHTTRPQSMISPDTTIREIVTTFWPDIDPVLVIAVSLVTLVLSSSPRALPLAIITSIVLVVALAKACNG